MDKSINYNNQDLELAIPSMKMQVMAEIYSLEQGLKAGTIFPELDKPFLYGRCQY